MPVTETDVKLAAKRLSNMIHRYVYDQLVLWRKIPALALEADGHNGYNHRYHAAFTHKLWPLDLNQHHDLGWVCLEHGRLVEWHNTARPLALEYTLIIAGHLDELNAQRIIHALTQPPPCHSQQREKCEMVRLRRALKQTVRRGPIATGID